ncbi:hypothetical protein [Thermocatellispora tengchongensis]|uniref:hypothetical protein n=1 Tax=Thermocatellispora tengchongensis TaxID=1073253 RepID=UPI003641EF94
MTPKTRESTLTPPPARVAATIRVCQAIRWARGRERPEPDRRRQPGARRARVARARAGSERRTTEWRAPRAAASAAASGPGWWCGRSSRTRPSARWRPGRWGGGAAAAGEAAAPGVRVQVEPVRDEVRDPAGLDAYAGAVAGFGEQRAVVGPHADAVVADQRPAG